MSNYVHQHLPGSHADVLKDVVYIATVRAIQEEHPEGVILVDTHSGPGVYDEQPEEFFKGAQKCIDNNNKPNTPAPVKKYVSLLNKLKTEFGEGTLPGSPLFARELMRDDDEHRLCDLNEQDVEGLFEDAHFEQLDIYDPTSLDFILPRDEPKHPIILIDPSYHDEHDWFKAKDLLDRILIRRSNATVLLWMPLIRNHRNRWSFPKAVKELAKDKASVGRYYCSIVVDKDGLEGSAMLVCNPNKNLDETLNEECMEWLAQTMNKGKADYIVEQAMKKKKKILPG